MLDRCVLSVPFVPICLLYLLLLVIIDCKLSETVRDSAFGMKVEGTVHHRDMLGNGGMPILLFFLCRHFALKKLVTSCSHRKKGPGTRLGVQLGHRLILL